MIVSDRNRHHSCTFYSQYHQALLLFYPGMQQFKSINVRTIYIYNSLNTLSFDCSICSLETCSWNIHCSLWPLFYAYWLHLWFRNSVYLFHITQEIAQVLSISVFMMQFVVIVICFQFALCLLDDIPSKIIRHNTSFRHRAGLNNTQLLNI